jgi:hypothetical protein
MVQILRSRIATEQEQILATDSNEAIPYDRESDFDEHTVEVYYSTQFCT